MKIYWCSVYEGELQLAGRLDLCDNCLRAAESAGEEVVPYNHECAGVCERCGRRVKVRE